jgi:hypothetical protein
MVTPALACTFLHHRFEAIQRHVAEHGRAHLSYNIAKRLLEFSTRIPRERLHASYGQEDTVGRHARQARKTLEVHVRFAVSHRAEACLADAYERLVPILYRSLSPAPPPLPSVGHPPGECSPLS